MIVVNAFIKKSVNQNGLKLGIGVARGGQRVHAPKNFQKI